MSELKYTHTLVATLGGQPQVVTFTLDLLLRRGIPITEVIVLHPEASHPRLQHSLRCLNAEFVSDQYRVDGRFLTCHFRPKVLEFNNTPLNDISDDASVEGTRQTIYSFIQELKQQPRHIYLSVTGGRRLMSFLAISAAQLKFDSFDSIWHIFTPHTLKEQVKDGKIMHVPQEAGVRLIEVPFFTLGDYILNASKSSVGTIQAAEHSQRAFMNAQEYSSCKQVEQALTKRQRSVLQTFAQGMIPQEVSDKLCISLSTVSTHTAKIFRECKNAWNLPDDYPINYHFLREKFGRYFDHDT